MSVRTRVLVCDADPQGLRALRVALRAGLEVDETGTAEAALEHAALRAPDAAIVELVLPDGDGAQLCRRLREWSAMPLIVLSAIDEEEHKVRALDAGADHYLTKPFAARELIARLHATLRRAHRCGDQPHLTLHGLEIDLAAHSVRREGQEVHLTPIEIQAAARPPSAGGADPRRRAPAEVRRWREFLALADLGHHLPSRRLANGAPSTRPVSSSSLRSPFCPTISVGSPVDRWTTTSDS
jgi:two-component system KDP operon response regulator KdpE